MVAYPAFVLEQRQGEQLDEVGQHHKHGKHPPGRQQQVVAARLQGASEVGGGVEADAILEQVFDDQAGVGGQDDDHAEVEQPCVNVVHVGWHGRSMSSTPGHAPVTGGRQTRHSYPCVGCA